MEGGEGKSIQYVKNFSILLFIKSIKLFIATDQDGEKLNIPANIYVLHALQILFHESL